MIRNNISSKKALEILKSLESKDFCYAMRNDNIDPRFADEVLYLFCKEIEHNVRGSLKTIDIYIKINLLETGDIMFIVSFHNFDRNKKGQIHIYLRNKAKCFIKGGKCNEK